MQQTTIRLNRDFAYRHYYLCNYLPESVGRDTFSDSLLRFKRGEHPDLEGWIDCSAEESAKIPVSPDTVILRALHHQESTAGLTGSASLDKLGQTLADRFNCLYDPTLLVKTKPVPEIKWLGKDQRKALLENAYRLTGPLPGNPATHYLVLDDIVTTGTTMNAIMEALCNGLSPSSSDQTAAPAPDLSSRLLAFSLARADYDPSMNRFSRLQGRHYQLEPGAGWLVADPTAGYSPVYSVGELTGWILQDFFPARP